MPESFDDMDASTLQSALDLVRRHTGISMSMAKRSMLQSRLRPRMRQLKLASYESYLQLLANDERERQPFIDAVTTHHTAFFRTPRIWQYLSDVFLPAWWEQHPERPLQVWSAAASTGEEACTIAICCEEFRRHHPGFRYQITATDIAAEVLERARRGEYAGSAVTAFQAAQPELFARYNALETRDRFMLGNAVRERISFSVHNLLQASPWEDAFDVVFLRNVLIYFKPEDVVAIVRKVAPALHARGVLMIGEAESLTSLDVPFQFEQPQIYRRAT
ncbi:protein-glutamate O-methyltransferase CheR [Massilia solisilvae]|uniref:protein-glutamate O-methyltransferase n=1 Tax=Massilia solisilvae TaxID=1811225 RepID=A0ABT2BQS1_9BURK|nr:protein-glutamate O-methyltransferase CheR [Massilia solisilvae]MCS0610858.1 protein-glutamate O-methyltransferase CheR [Massilia solisilvae]